MDESLQKELEGKLAGFATREILLRWRDEQAKKVMRAWTLVPSGA